MTGAYYNEPREDIQALVEPAGRRFLDVGCGAGELAAALKRAGAAHVAGIEQYPAAAAQARRRVDVLVEGSVLESDLPFAPGEFDYIVFADVLEHLVNPDRALERCLPFLAGDGRVIVSVPNMRFYLVLLRLMRDRWSYTDSGIRDRTHLRIFTRHSLEATLERAGLRIERLERNSRLFEDQSEIGRVGALATRAARATVARFPFADLMAFQYRVVARRTG